MKRPPLKSINKLPTTRAFFGNSNDNDHNVDKWGFKKVVNGGRPRPQTATLGMHLVNAFGVSGSIHEDGVMEQHTTQPVAGRATT